MAKEYIERKPILKFIEDGLNNPDKSKAFGHDAIEIMTEVQYAPAADVVEVVRCVHCKHATLSSIWPPYCDKHKRAVKEEGFCSDGERRDNNADD